MTEASTTTVTQVPPRIAEYVKGYFSALKNLRLGSRYRLTDEQLETLALTLRGVFYKEIKLDDFPAQVRDRVKLEAGQAFYLAADAGDQHFTAFEDYLGPVRDNVQQWRAWGREFGGKLPGAKAAPGVEQLIARASDVRTAPTLEMRSNGAEGKVARPARQVEKKTQQSQARQPARVMPSRAVERAATRTVVTASARQATGMSREQFLDQVRSFSVEKMRPAGQPAVQRLAQVRDSLQRVVASNPGDQQALTQALRQSPLFRLYQEMGQESLRTQQPIDRVIYARYQSGQPYLLREEFDTVGQLAAITTPAAHAEQAQAVQPTNV